MAKNGYLIFDSDTHVGPNMDVLSPYLSSKEKEALESISQFKRGNRYMIGERKYDRRLGDAEPRPADPNAYMSGLFTGGSKRSQQPARDGDANPAARIADMDTEGVDVNLLLPSGWFGVWTMDQVSPEIEQSIYRAYHRWMKDYCGAYPDRLTGLILISGRDPEGSLEELKRVAKEPWAMGVFSYAPYGMPLDHPAFEPHWAVAEENDLSMVIHTFTVMPPYAPGGLDNWENLFLQRSAAHPWCGMRNMASIIGAGILDRYPSLRLGVLEAGHGWLPSWGRRLDEHAHSVAGAIPALKQTPTEYITGGRFFQSIEMSEGLPITQAVIDILGDHVLMYASDYPHAESWFPESVNTVMAWDMSHEQKKKLFWDNAINFYRRYQPSKQLVEAAVGIVNRPSQGRKLRDLLARTGVVLPVLGTPDAGSAKIMEAAGVEAAFIGTGITGGRYTGLGDTGLITATEALWIAKYIAAAVSFPIILDGDTGHGGPPAIRRLVHECIRIGLAGIRLDDQEIEAKRGTQSGGISIVERDHAVERYQAAVAAKNELDPDFVIMAQCYARDAVNGSMDELLVRLPLYETEGGCDWVQFESPHSVDEVKQVRAVVKGPLSAMRGKLPKTLTIEEHAEIGLNAAWYTGWPSSVMYAAVRNVMKDYPTKGPAVFYDLGSPGPEPRRP